MDVILKPEWEGKALRQKCWPLPKADQEELELQAEEIVKVGLAEAYPPGKFPEVCSPTFLVDKKRLQNPQNGNTVQKVEREV